jgi:hypothetical protein
LYILTNTLLATLNLASLTFIAGDLDIRTNVVLANINFTSLTYIRGYLHIENNAVLAVNLPSLSTVAGFLAILGNPSLTFASLPNLTLIELNIAICANNDAFRIPSGPPDAPNGGLTSAGAKDQPECYFQQGNGTCSFVTCP